jgi:hypothetical protein
MPDNAGTSLPASRPGPADATAESAPAPAAAPLFPLGQVVATPAALAAAGEHSIDLPALVARHQRGDWGQVPAADAAANAAALRDGKRILSAYGQGGSALLIITEADRSATAVLRPEEY